MMSFKVSLVLALIVLAASSQAEIVNRILGGDTATEYQFPYQISLRLNGTHVCGGSLLTDRVVLTGARCVVRYETIHFPVEYFQVYAGSIDRLAGGVLVNVTKILVHRLFGNYLNDLALLKLSEPLVFSERIQPIELDEEVVPPGTDVIVSGWGNPTLDIAMSEVLQYGTLQAISKRKCFAEIGLYFDLLLCLTHESGYGICGADAGSPAVVNGLLVGVAGFMKNGCGADSADGFASMAYHAWWVKQEAGFMMKEYN